MLPTDVRAGNDQFAGPHLSQGRPTDFICCQAGTNRRNTHRFKPLPFVFTGRPSPIVIAHFKRIDSPPIRGRRTMQPPQFVPESTKTAAGIP